MGEVYRKVEFGGEKGPRIERAKEAVKYWKESFDQVWEFLQEAEAQQGKKFDEEDPLLTAIKISAMNLSASKDALKEAEKPN